MRYFLIFEEFNEVKGLSKKHKIEVPECVFKDSLSKFPSCIKAGFTE